MIGIDVKFVFHVECSISNITTNVNIPINIENIEIILKYEITFNFRMNNKGKTSADITHVVVKYDISKYGEIKE